MPTQKELLKAHSQLAGGIIRRIFVREELQDFWRSFWELPTETGVGKESLTEIISESMGLSRSAVKAGSSAQKAEWCMKLLGNVEVIIQFGYAFRQLNPDECKKADELLKAEQVSDFVTFATASFMTPKQALVYLVTAGFGMGLFFNSPKLKRLLSQGMQVNGILDLSRN